jgi:thiosulfate/3-mercaptopyruvate sulfurtransferase
MVKKKLLFGVIALTLVALLVPLCAACPAAPTTPTSTTPPTAPTRAIDPIVTTGWLASNIDTPGLVLLDVRDPDSYAAGHIPGSVNFFALGNFYLCLFEFDCGLWMEVPADEDLFATMGNAGISADSTVVIIARTVDSPVLGPAPYGVANATRVADTLIYAGLEKVTLLDGGYAKWAAEGRAVTTEATTPTPVTYTGTTDPSMFVSMDYVANRVGDEDTTIVEGREADIYFGIEQEPWTERAGHIPSALDLPAPWFWQATVDEAGVTTYTSWKDTSAIREIATTVLGNDGDQEIIVYCGVGGYASTLWYVATQIVGYRDVKFYDGSLQEWSADPTKDVIKYKYE